MMEAGIDPASIRKSASKKKIIVVAGVAGAVGLAVLAKKYAF